MDRELLWKLAECLEELSYNNLTGAEREIARLLEAAGFLEYDSKRGKYALGYNCPKNLD